MLGCVGEDGGSASSRTLLPSPAMVASSSAVGDAPLDGAELLHDRLASLDEACLRVGGAHTDGRRLLELGVLRVEVRDPGLELGDSLGERPPEDLDVCGVLLRR